jgi:thiol-disulfide isomerase/thioredoxin/outer membrane lipoprotein-sorting protein
MNACLLPTSALAFCLACIPFASDAQTNSVATAPEAKAKFNPEAQALLEQVEKAYDDLKSVEMSGEVSVNIDVDGELEKTNQQFASSFEAPNKFRHETKGGFTLGSTGERVYVFNERANSYLWLDPFGKKGSVRELPAVIPQVLQTQNPSLLFALTTNPVQEVMLTFDQAEKGVDVKLEGKSFPVVEMTSSSDGGRLKILVDPDTHLIRQFTVDFKFALEQSGAQEVKNASVVVDYAMVKVDPRMSTNYFAWNPPAEAFNMRESAGAQRPEKPAGTSLENKTAPDFILPSLNGERVSLRSLKGSVVVLDFWATWCPPCVKSLPKLAEMDKAEPDDEVKFFAINLQEDKDKVETFLQVKHIEIPVLLDEAGDVSQRYQVRSIPQTVVIGKDGKVKKVLVGVGPNTEEDLQKAIDAAQKQAR